MSRITYLDIDELNERLSELIGLRDARAEAQTELEEAKAALAAFTGNPAEREEAETAVEDADTALAGAVEAFGEDEIAELARLEALRDEIGSKGDEICTDGAPFVAEHSFEDYARELAVELGCIPDDARWPCTCVDWERAARELAMDYSSVEWDGTTYLYRS